MPEYKNWFLSEALDSYESFGIFVKNASLKRPMAFLKWIYFVTIQVSINTNFSDIFCGDYAKFTCIQDEKTLLEAITHWFNRGKVPE